jgi:hypothetical membrane protein
MADPASDATSASSDTPQSASSKLFDIRLLIGALFALYGVMLTLAGLFTSDSDLKKASGININLLLGIGMLVLGGLFLLWRQLSPQRAPSGTDQPDRTEPR